MKFSISTKVRNNILKAVIIQYLTKRNFDSRSFVFSLFFYFVIEGVENSKEDENYL